MSAETTKKEIVLEDVLAYLNEGKTRKEIAEIYSLSNRDMINLFKSPGLKGKKVKVPPSFVLVSREVKEETPIAETTTATTQEEEQVTVAETVVAETTPVAQPVTPAPVNVERQEGTIL